jgi:hypothetical protein
MEPNHWRTLYWLAVPDSNNAMSNPLYISRSLGHSLGSFLEFSSNGHIARLSPRLLPRMLPRQFLPLSMGPDPRTEEAPT